MTTTLPQVAATYVQATNAHDRAAFIACFTPDAIVDDAGREFRGAEAIRGWSDREIMDALVTLEVLNVTEQDGQIVISTKVDGNFDRTGLPDPVIIDHSLTLDGDRIARLQCRLGG